MSDADAATATAAPAPPTNVHYISVLVYNPSDPISPEKRLAWLNKLFAYGPFPMTLFADDLYRRQISVADHPGLTIVPWHTTDSEVWRRAREGGGGEGGTTPLRLPMRRNEAKDTEFFMLLMHTKAELVAAVASAEQQHFASQSAKQTPFLAFIDAGIAKIFGNVEASVQRLRTLRLSAEKIGSSILVPGCWEPKPYPFELLANQINWTFCGGLFFLQRETAQRFWEAQLRALTLFFAKGQITWEVNTWVQMLRDTEAPSFAWFPADHNDSMSVIPQEFQE